uniref:Protein WAX2 n=1 Tax=Cajanus cajan TaxID=3821 RepID=A0A151R1C6_CAJCA|nr:Protein WAX2 [Cajanus cajan]
MASRPGILTDWPWKPLGSFKYLLVAPWAIHSFYSLVVEEKSERRDISTFLILPFLLWRMLHNQIWISLSRYRTAKGNTRIVDKGIEFDQVDRERDWDDQILFNGLLYYLGCYTIPGATHLPLWRTDGVVMTILLHMGPVEFLYYWLHRALHHHFLYSRYHSHHHSSIVTEPITSVIHPFGEHILYFLLFAIPKLTIVFTRTASVGAMVAYVTYIDFMNNMGHCNFEVVPKWLFDVFPPLKYLMYTPSFHSLHHTQFRTNYSLFMPLYDYIYGTTDKASDKLHESSLKREEEIPDVVHLTHLTTPESIYYLRFGFAYLASKPYTSKWYLCLMWPITAWSMILTWVYGRTFIVEGNRFDKLKLQTWAIPKFSLQQNKVHITMGFFLVVTLHENDYVRLKKSFTGSETNLAFTKSYTQTTWLVGDDLTEEEQLKAPKGTLFIPYTQFPPKKYRKDCSYHCTPAMLAPCSIENVHSCEDWLPRRVMSAWRIAGIVHCLEGWSAHECGHTMHNVDKVWHSTLQHGFQPLSVPLKELAHY